MKTTNPILQALAAAALFGASAPAGKLLVGSFSPLQLAGLLYLGAALAVLPSALSAFKSGGRAWMNRGNIVKIAGSLACGGILAPVFFLVGLERASATSVSMWLALEGILTALLAYLLFKEHLGRFGFLAVAGAALAAGVLSFGEGAAGFEAGLFVAVACLLWGLDNNFSALVDGIRPAQLTFLKGAVAGSLNLAIGCFSAGFEASPAQTAGALLIGAFSYGLSLTLYIRSAQSLGASRSQLLFATSPIWGVLLSFAVLQEQIAAPHLVSALILAGAIVLLFRDQHAHLHAHERMAHVHAHSHDDGHHTHRHDEVMSGPHSHWHEHEPVTHAHPHWPDLHHRHRH